MVSRSMTNGRIRVGATPSEDGSAIDDEAPRSHQPTTKGCQHTQHEEGLWHRRTSTVGALALLRRTGNAGSSIQTLWQVTSQGKGRPSHEPVMQILIRQTPQRA